MYSKNNNIFIPYKVETNPQYEYKTTNNLCNLNEDKVGVEILDGVNKLSFIYKDLIKYLDELIYYKSCIGHNQN